MYSLDGFHPSHYPGLEPVFRFAACDAEKSFSQQSHSTLLTARSFQATSLACLLGGNTGRTCSQSQPSQLTAWWFLLASDSDRFPTVPGEQIQPARCFEVDVGVVDESLCDPEGRPEDKHRKCKTVDCPARFLVFTLRTKTCHSLAAVFRRKAVCSTSTLSFLLKEKKKNCSFFPSVLPWQVVGGRVAAVHCRLRTGGGAEADGALRSHRVGRGKSPSPRRVQTPPEAKAHGALQQRRAVWTGLGCQRLGRGFLLFFSLNSFLFSN